MDLADQKKIGLLSDMLRIRKFEERTRELFAHGKIPGFVHAYIGEEAIAVGVCAALEDDDYITSTHRGHGHCIAKGVDLGRMFAELMGRKTGYCAGRGGSMHIADFSKGVLGANGIVGGGIPTATGVGLSCQIQKNGRVCVCFLGDGAMAQGGFHESLNIASLWKLPVIYVCENNQYGECTHYLKQHSVQDLSIRASAYGMPGERVDGMDVLKVYKAASKAVDRARRGGGPTLLECVAYRFFGHFEGDPETYRTREEKEQIMKLDPIPKLENELLQASIITEEDIAKMEKEIEAEILKAVAFAEASEYPEPETALEGVFV